MENVIWEFAECEYDEREGQLWVRKKKKNIYPKTQEVLLALLRAEAHKVAKRELLERLWGSPDADDQPLSNEMSRLRDAVLPADGSIVIGTLRGFGYQIIVPVKRRETKEQVGGIRFSSGEYVPGNPEWRLEQALDAKSPPRVWLAHNSATRQAHVFKFADDSKGLRRLKRELEVFQRFVERGIDLGHFVRLLNWRETTKPYFIETEYGGQALSEWAEAQRRTGGLRPEICVQIVIELAEAVDAAHSCGVLHNNIQPSSVLVSSPNVESDSRWHVRLANFRAATFLGSGDQKLQEYVEDGGAGAGNGEMYQAPEVAAGNPATSASDVYSIGIILFKLLCGDFNRRMTSDWERFVEDPTLQKDIAETTSSDAGRRPRSAGELSRRLRDVEARRICEKEQALELRAQKERAEAAEMRLAKTEARRPLVAAAIAILIAGTCTSSYFYRRAAKERDLVNARNADLLAMNDFLSIDLMGQSNPYLRSGQSGSVQQLTLLDAIEHALPQIDQRFAKAPEIAGQLHEGIAGALDARTDFAAAEQQFEIAAQWFRKAEGTLSENAIIAELRRENTEVRTQLPESVSRARQDFKIQSQLIKQLPNITPEVQAWQALAESALTLFETDARPALQLLKDALSRAEATPGFSPLLLIALKGRFIGLYLKVEDPKNAERAARDVINTVTVRLGLDSPQLFQLQMLLDEALYAQGKFQETIKQSGQDYARFFRLLGPTNQLTLSALFVKAAAEGSLEDYDDGIRDELNLNAFAASDPSGNFLREDSLSLAASLECHARRFRAGKEHARQVIRETGSGATNQPAFANSATFTMAECLIGEAEGSGGRHEAELTEADNILKTVDVPLVSRTVGLADFEGAVDVAEARIALLRGDRSSAKKYAEEATPFLEKPGSDPYELKELRLVRDALRP